MKVLLLYPPTARALPGILPCSVESSRGFFPPLGILYLAAQAQEIPGVEVMVRDAPTQNLRAEQLAAEVADKSIDLVGISILSFHLLDAVEVAQKIKEKSPKTLIIAGGPHPHIYPQETLGLGMFDYVALGEGEEIFSVFLKKLSGGEKDPSIPGIISKSHAQTAELDFCAIADLDSLKFPARKLLPIEKYYSVLSPHRPSTTAVSSRGCPYRCIFCDRPHLGKRFRARSAENVVAEMEACIALGIKEVNFYDDNFTTNRERALEIAELIQKRKLKIAWDIRARVGDLQPEDYLLLRKSGLERIHFGVESGDPELLEAINKKITVAQAREAFQSANRARIETLAYFIIGLPGETADTLNRTFALGRELNPDFIHFSLLMLFPATPVYALALEKGIVKKDLWREFSKKPNPGFTPPIWEENLKQLDLISALHKAYREFYLRPGYLLSRLGKTRSWHGFKNQARMGLSILGLNR
jgi:anaerobic magnesium-protoporphyrin IX monomethyl ester cyclase